jgi:hypothetical protein
MAEGSVSVGELLTGWAQANPPWAAGLQLAPEIDVLPTAGPTSAWGDGLPEGLSVAPDGPAWLAAMRLGGYLAYDEATLGTLGQDIAPARVLVLSDAAQLDARGPGLVSRFVEAGGTLLAFGHAGSVEADFPLADVFGVQRDGLVQFDTEASRVTLTADTTYAPQFSPPNVIDGQAGTFWASIEAGPMPHWVQLDFAKPRTAAGAHVSCRPGFLLKDLEVQARVGEDWQTLATVTDNGEWDIDCPFEQPVEAQSFRLFVSREELNGEDRVIADVGEFTLLDDRGARLIAPPYLIEGRILDAAWAKANRSDRLVLRSPAVRLKPTTAKVLATFPDPLTAGPLPLCVVNRLGKGRAYLFAVPEAAFGFAPETWEPLLRHFVGLPMVRHSGDENVVAVLRRGKGRAILHLIDTTPVESEERAKEAIVRIDVQALGKVRLAKLLPEQTPVELRAHEGWTQFTMPINPLGSVLLELAR